MAEQTESIAQETLNSYMAGWAKLNRQTDRHIQLDIQRIDLQTMGLKPIEWAQLLDNVAEALGARSVELRDDPESSRVSIVFHDIAVELDEIPPHLLRMEEGRADRASMNRPTKRR